MNKPWAEACERNQQPIADVLSKEFAGIHYVLEIGSGTGQHAVYVAERNPHLIWQPTELPECLTGIEAWIADAPCKNVLSPIALDVGDGEWLLDNLFDGVFTANTVHFVGWTLVRAMFNGISRATKSGAIVCIYGPFNEGGEFTSEGNARLDAWLKSRDPESGIKDRDEVIDCAARYGLTFARKHTMPANNQMLTFTKQD